MGLALATGVDCVGRNHEPFNNGLTEEWLKVSQGNLYILGACRAGGDLVGLEMQD